MPFGNAHRLALFIIGSAAAGAGVLLTAEAKAADDASLSTQSSAASNGTAAPSSPDTGNLAPSPGGNHAAGTDSSSPGAGNETSVLAPVVVTARRLNLERSEIETLTGASTTTIDAGAITAMAGGSNVQLNQVLLQAPDVVLDSFGQVHVRGDHGDLQYRLNGIILPEGISVFSQTLDPRIISSMNLITGALPAEYGLRTAGIVEMTTKNGLQQPGGSASIYGGSHSTFEPSAWYGGSSGSFSYFASADMLRNDLGIDSPDGSSNPLHDHTTQTHAFGYFEDILNENNRLSLVVGLSDEQFQIPNVRGAQPSGVAGVVGAGPCGTGTAFYPPPCQDNELQVLQVYGRNAFLSDNLDENQHELAQYAILSWQYGSDRLHLVSSVSARYSSLDFEPDWTGDLLYNGIAQNAFKSDVALAWQTDAAYHLSDKHVLRAGVYLQHDQATSDTTSQALTVDPITAAQTSTVPSVIIDNGAQSQGIESLYLQDEWNPIEAFTLNFGVRYDAYHAYSAGSQLSPRVNFVWNAPTGTTLHGGFSRYFTPPPFELIGGATLGKFSNTTALPPGSVLLDDTPIAERADYYDFGVQQKLLSNALTLGVDSYFRTSQHLIDEGQFGAPIILTPFNYRFGRIGGIELTGNYTLRAFSTYANLAFQTARGKQVESSQFNFSPAELAYIADNFIHLDHEERVSASAGIAYTWLGTRADLDMIFGTGLRQALVLADGSTIPNGDHTPSYTQWNLGVTHAFHDAAGLLTLRFDVINLLDKVYQIRSGTGIGVFLPQYGPRRGLFGGVSQDF